MSAIRSITVALLAAAALAVMPATATAAADGFPWDGPAPTSTDGWPWD